MKRSKRASASKTKLPKPRPKSHRQDSGGGVLRHHCNRLDAYLRDRARVEGFGYDLTPDFFISAFRAGTRMMFGICICDHGMMLGDDQEPYPGYFDAWMEAHASGPPRLRTAPSEAITPGSVGVETAMVGEVRRHPAAPVGFAREDEVVADELIGTIRSCARQLITASWVCDSVAPTITGFVEDLRSGYSTHDLPVDDLRAASLAAGELTAICKVNDWSIRHALAMASVRDELFFDAAVSA